MNCVSTSSVLTIILPVTHGSTPIQNLSYSQGSQPSLPLSSYPGAIMGYELVCQPQAGNRLAMFSTVIDLPWEPEL